MDQLPTAVNDLIAAGYPVERDQPASSAPLSAPENDRKSRVTHSPSITPAITIQEPKQPLQIGS